MYGEPESYQHIPPPPSAYVVDCEVCGLELWPHDRHECDPDGLDCDVVFRHGECEWVAYVDSLLDSDAPDEDVIPEHLIRSGDEDLRATLHVGMIVEGEER